MPGLPGTSGVRGFGESDKHQADPAAQYDAAAQARSVIGLIEELALGEWSDRIGEFFSAAELSWLDGAGHFSPLEAPEEFAAAIDAAARTGPG